MRWAARALTLVLVLTGCGQLPSARLVTTSVERPEPPAPPSPASEDEREEAAPARRAAGPAARPGRVRQPSGSEPPAPAGTVHDIPIPSPSSRLALIVGIDDYPGDRDLRAAEADARLVTRTLGRLGFPVAATRVLLGGEATAERITEGLRWLGRGTGDGSLGVFFYAGHVRKLSGDPDGDGEELDEALVGSDGGTVSDGALARALAPARGRMWLAYAGCYAEGFDDAEAPGRISTYASDEEGLSYESTSLGHSFMVEYLFRRAVPEAGPVWVEGLYRGASQQMEGRDERFRPLQDDRVRGELVLGEIAAQSGPPPSPTPSPGSRPCLFVLRCKS